MQLPQQNFHAKIRLLLFVKRIEPKLSLEYGEFQRDANQIHSKMPFNLIWPNVYDYALCEHAPCTTPYFSHYIQHVLKIDRKKERQTY